MPALFQPFDLPEGIILLITDELAAPADFVLHRTLATHLKDRKQPKSLILSVSEGLSRWKALAAKVFVDVLAEVQPSVVVEEASTKPNSSFRILLDRVQTYLDRAKDDPTLIILDDITMLDWIGFPVLDVIRFFRALRGACLAAHATLLVRHHMVIPNEPDDLFRHLLQICTYHLEVRPLLSGRSGAVSGEVSLHSGFSVSAETVKLIPRSTAMQYRLTDVGPVFFAKGTGGGVL
ncbi:hypothetical protein BDZ97DRAFT_1836152 [Flammula alnicola]|nr:hypothetical protein BDZ97DRAFT_1836152 [Flammula alnicola]